MLTQVQCRNAKPRAKAYKLTDGRGLYLDVRPTGNKYWRYRFEMLRGDRRVEQIATLGEFVAAPVTEKQEQAARRRAGGSLTLAEARLALEEARSLVKQGISPVRDKQRRQLIRADEMATTVEVIAEEWLAAKVWEDITKTRRRMMMRRVIFPLIGGTPIKDVTPQHVLAVLEAAHKKNGPSVAAEAKRTMSGFFGHAIATLRLDRDPVSPVRNALPPNKTQHKRPLTREELGRFLRDLDAYERNHQTVAVFKLMWLTLCRPNEALGMRWAEVDWEQAVWRIPASRMKMRLDHQSPLSRQALATLSALQPLTGHREHVFPHRDDRAKHMTDAALRQALGNMGWAGTYSPHATRATGSTMLNERGYNPDWIERQLAHRSTNTVRSTYNQAHYVDDRRSMMQEWADYLDALKSSESHGG